jgi:hypothetical protein
MSRILMTYFFLKNSAEIILRLYIVRSEGIKRQNALLIIGCVLSLVASYEAGNMVIDFEGITEEQTATNIRTYLGRVYREFY